VAIRHDRLLTYARKTLFFTAQHADVADLGPAGLNSSAGRDQERRLEAY